jgi:HEPN domain-containing protein
MKSAASTVSFEEMGKDYFEHARRKYEEGKMQFEKERWPDSISSFQETIEFCAKAAFYFVGLDYPKAHRISDEEFAKLHKALPPKLENIALGRLYFTMEFWSQVRNLAKYGSQSLRVPSKEFFWDSGEATLAMKHAKHAFTIAFIIGKGTGALEGKDPI